MVFNHEEFNVGDRVYIRDAIPYTLLINGRPFCGDESEKNKIRNTTTFIVNKVIPPTGINHLSDYLVYCSLSDDSSKDIETTSLDESASNYRLVKSPEGFFSGWWFTHVMPKDHILNKNEDN